MSLDDDGALVMAHPFSARPAQFRARPGEGVWYANCAWDALVIPALLQMDAENPARCAQSGAELPPRVRDRKLDAPERLMHFAAPVRHGCDNIGFT